VPPFEGVVVANRCAYVLHVESRGMGESHFPWWAAIAVGAAVLLLLVGVILAFSADMLENSEDFPKDEDQARAPDNMRNWGGFLGDLARLAIGAALVAVAAFTSNPAWARVVYAVTGVLILVPGLGLL